MASTVMRLCCVLWVLPFVLGTTTKKPTPTLHKLRGADLMMAVKTYAQKADGSLGLVSVRSLRCFATRPADPLYVKPGQVLQLVGRTLDRHHVWQLPTKADWDACNFDSKQKFPIASPLFYTIPSNGTDPIYFASDSKRYGRPECKSFQVKGIVQPISAAQYDSKDYLSLYRNDPYYRLCNPIYYQQAMRKQNADKAWQQQVVRFSQNNSVKVDWNTAVTSRSIDVSPGTNVFFVWNDNVVDYDVYQFMDKRSFDNCDFTSTHAVLLATKMSQNKNRHNAVPAFGDVMFSAVSPGEDAYFASSAKDYCKNGYLKLHVHVWDNRPKSDGGADYLRSKGRLSGGAGALEAYNTALVILGGFFILFCPYGLFYLKRRTKQKMKESYKVAQVRFYIYVIQIALTSVTGVITCKVAANSYDDIKRYGLDSVTGTAFAAAVTYAACMLFSLIIVIRDLRLVIRHSLFLELFWGVSGLVMVVKASNELGGGASQSEWAVLVQGGSALLLAVLGLPLLAMSFVFVFIVNKGKSLEDIEQEVHEDHAKLARQRSRTFFQAYAESNMGLDVRLAKLQKERDADEEEGEAPMPNLQREREGEDTAIAKAPKKKKKEHKDEEEEEEENEAKTKSGARWVVGMCCAMFLFFHYYLYSNLAVLYTYFTGCVVSCITVEQYNMMYSAYSYPNIVLPVVGGYLTDRFGNRLTFLIFSSVLAVGGFLIPIGTQLQAYPLMVVGMVLQGIGGECGTVASTTLLYDWFPAREVSFMFGLTSFFSSAGSTIVDATGTLLVRKWSFSGSLYFGACCGGMCAVCAVIVFVLDIAADKRGEKMEQEGGEGQTESLLTEKERAPSAVSMKALDPEKADASKADVAQLEGGYVKPEADVDVDPAPPAVAEAEADVAPPAVPAVSEETARQVFEDADKNKNGFLTKSELRKYFKKHPEQKERILGSDFEWNDFFTAMDTDDDHQFDVNEFTSYVCRAFKSENQISPNAEAKSEDAEHAEPDPDEISFDRMNEAYKDDNDDEEEEEEEEEHGHGKITMKDLKKFTIPIWVFAFATFLYESAMGPWCNIESDLLVRKFYAEYFVLADDVINEAASGASNISYHQQAVEMANYWMMIPFSLAAVLAPIFGFIIGKVGMRLSMFIMGTVFLALAHAHFIFMPGVPFTGMLLRNDTDWDSVGDPVFWNLDVPWYAHPTWPLVFVGISYMTYWNIVWSMPMFTVPDLEGIATGVLTMAANIGLAVYPTFVGILTKDEVKDPSAYVGGYRDAEILLFGTAVLCGIVVLALRIFHKDGRRLDAVDPNSWVPPHLRVKDVDDADSMADGLLENEAEEDAAAPAPLPTENRDDDDVQL